MIWFSHNAFKADKHIPVCISVRGGCQVTSWFQSVRWQSGEVGWPDFIFKTGIWSLQHVFEEDLAKRAVDVQQARGDYITIWEEFRFDWSAVRLLLPVKKNYPLYFIVWFLCNLNYVPRLTSKQVEPPILAHVPESTNSRALINSNINGWPTRRKPPLSIKHTATHMQFTDDHMGEPDSCWNNVLWT